MACGGQWSGTGTLRREVMARIDGWTDARVDYAIALLVQAERIVREVEPDLYDKIRRFLLEEA
jgi:hypothetical protein